MFYELENLLSRGERVVVTGTKGTGKSTLISKFSSKYNSFRSTWYCSECTSKKLLDKYQLFDRCNYLDRYAWQYHSDEAKEVCILNFKSEFEGVYVTLLFNDLWRNLRDFKGEQTEERKVEVERRYLDICWDLFDQGVIKGLVVSTAKEFWSTDYYDVEVMRKGIQEELL